MAGISTPPTAVDDAEVIRAGHGVATTLKVHDMATNLIIAARGLKKTWWHGVVNQACAWRHKGEGGSTCLA